MNNKVSFIFICLFTSDKYLYFFNNLFLLYLTKIVKIEKINVFIKKIIFNILPIHPLFH